MATASATEVVRRATSVARYRQLVELAAGLAGVLLACAVGALLLVAAAAFEAPGAVRFALIVATALAASALALIGALRVLRSDGPLATAAAVERHFPELRDRFVTAVEMAAQGRPTPPSIARTLFDQAEKVVGPLNLRRAIDTRRARTLSAVALAACAAVVATVLLLPGAWSELIHPAPPSPVAPAFAPQSAPLVPSVTGPSIADIAVRLEYPAYTKRPVETRTTGLDGLSVLVGTRVTISALIAGDGAVPALILDGASREVEVLPDSRIAAQLTVTADAAWRLVVKTPSGESMQTPTHRLVAVPDAPPRIRITEPDARLLIPSPRPVRLAFRAEDDWGLRGVTLHYRESGADSWSAETLASAGGRVLTGAWNWDLRPLRLTHGESISYRLSTLDNDTVSGPKRATTAAYTITIGDETAAIDPEERVEEAEAYEADAMENLERETEELRRRLDEMLARLEEGDMSADEQSERATELQEAQRKVAEQADRASRSLAESERRLEADKATTPEALDKIRELHDLLQEAMNEELAEALKALEESLKQQDAQQMQQGLEQAREQHDEFEMSLEQVMQLLERARLEQDIARVADRADRLTQEQAELNEADEQARPEAQADEQRELAAEEKRVEEQLSELRDQAAEINDPSAASLSEMSQQLQEAGTQSTMQQAAQQLQQSKPQEAAQSQEQALQDLQQLSASLDQLQSEMSGEDAQRMARELQAMTRDALFLSHEQEQAMASTEAMDAFSANAAAQGKALRESVRREQQSLEAGARELAERMRGLAAQTEAFDPALARETDEAAAVMARAGREASGGAGAQAAASQREAMSRLNEISDKMIRMAENSQQGGQGSSMQQLMQQLQNMAKQQRGLNQRTQGAQQRQGQSPSERGAQGDLADEQAALREALRKLLERAGEESGLGEQLGNVPGEMSDVEQQLRGGRLGTGTVQQQRDILHHMLDAQRSVYKKDQQRRQRVAERPKPFKLPPSPPQLTPRSDPPLGPQVASDDDSLLPLDYEDVVKEYFRALANVRP